MISRFLVRLVLNLRQGRFVIEIHIISADKRVEKLSVYGQPAVSQLKPCVTVRSSGSYSPAFLRCSLTSSRLLSSAFNLAKHRRRKGQPFCGLRLGHPRQLPIVLERVFRHFFHPLNSSTRTATFSAMATMSKITVSIFMLLSVDKSQEKRYTLSAWGISPLRYSVKCRIKSSTAWMRLKTAVAKTMYLVVRSS